MSGRVGVWKERRGKERKKGREREKEVVAFVINAFGRKCNFLWVLLDSRVKIKEGRQVK